MGKNKLNQNVRDVRCLENAQGNKVIDHIHGEKIVLCKKENKVDMMLEEELKRILCNLSIDNSSQSENKLIDFEIGEKNEKLLRIIDAIGNKSDFETKEINIIDIKELYRFEQILRDEISEIINIQQAVFENDKNIYERINIQQWAIDSHYYFNNLNDAIYKFGNSFNGLLWKFRDMLIKICKGNLYNEQAIIDGNIRNINLDGLNEVYYQLVTQLDYMFRYYELDMIRKELVNIVKYITIKVEMRSK